MEMVTCANCGKQVEGNVAFCRECGAPLKAAPTRPTPPPVYTNPAAPQPQPYPQNAPMSAYEPAAKTGKGMGWIVFLRVILWLVFAACVISGLSLGVQAMDIGETGVGFLIILGGILVGFMAVASGMVALNNATNLRTIASNTAKTVELLQKMKREK